MQELLNIENNCEQKFEESKLNILGEVMWAFGTVAKPLMSEIPWRWFSYF
jgi:hypothetical protein